MTPLSRPAAWSLVQTNAGCFSLHLEKEGIPSEGLQGSENREDLEITITFLKDGAPLGIPFGVAASFIRQPFALRQVGEAYWQLTTEAKEMGERGPHIIFGQVAVSANEEWKGAAVTG